MDKDEQLLLKRLSDLAHKAEQQYYCTFSEFLNMNEQDIFLKHKEDFAGVHYEMYGGYPDAERRMIAFYPDDYVKEKFPIDCLSVHPVNEKFSDHLTHRDFLGAILNLGIDRNRIGDLLIDQNSAYVFCICQISAYITEHLTKVKHTKITSALCDVPEIALSPKFRTKQGTVTSIRLDSVVALAFNLSRTTAAGYISAGLVFINGKLTESASAVPKSNDIISVRKLGRFKFENTALKSKKDKFVVKAHIYM